MSLFPVRLLAAIALLAWLAGCQGAPPAPAPARGDLLVMTSLPLVWSETTDVTTTLDDTAPPHWARAVLEGRWRLVPLDAIEAGSLAGHRNLLMAQPRALAGPENVALDSWVRGGGHLLLLADPLLTAHTDLPPGDPRRPLDVALLSPILRHWGLELQFDVHQAAAERTVDYRGVLIPVALPGVLVKQAGDADCSVVAGGLVAECRIGRGRATIVADAALLDRERAPDAGRPALAALTSQAFRR